MACVPGGTRACVDERFVVVQPEIAVQTTYDRARPATFPCNKKSGLLFAHVEFGYHQLFLAHLCALHKTDFSREQLKWSVHQFPYADPIKKLSDDFVDQGYGLFLSNCSNGQRITVGQTFAWEALEQAAFGRFERDVI